MHCSLVHICNRQPTKYALRESMGTCRKAVKGATVLLPLLGITNFLGMVHSPVDRPDWEFALWSYITHFLDAFQGFFVALLYCFLHHQVPDNGFRTLAIHCIACMSADFVLDYFTGEGLPVPEMEISFVG